MLMRQIKAGTVDVSVVLRIIDSTDGTPETGVVFNTSGIDLEYRREGAATTDITEVTLAALTTAHTDGGFLHVGNGYYRLDLPDAACASGVPGVLVHGTVTGMVVIGVYVELVVNTAEDVYARVGAPAGASVSADVAAVKVDTAATLVDTGTTLDGRLPAALVGGRMDANVGAISSDVTAADNAEAFFDGTGYAGANNVIPTVTTLTGHTAQTGDAYARLGAPAGASVSADLLVIDNLVDDLESRLGTPSNLGGGATVAANLADIEAQTDDIGAAGAGLTALGDTRIAVLSDWINGGRLDLILDIIAADTTTDLPALIAALSTAAELAKVPKSDGTATWNATALAGIQSEAQDAITASALATAANLATVAGYLDTEIAAILADTNELQTDWVNGGRLDLILDAASAPSAAAVADAVWDEAIAGHLTGGTTGAALNGAGSAGDPWTTAIPGAYGAGTAGKILGDNVNATISSRASQASVDAVDDLVDTEVAAIKTVVDAILVDTGTTLDGRIPAALVSGRIDASVGAMAANVMTAAAAAADLTTELQSGLATAAALATVDGIVDDILLDTVEIGAAGAGLTNINLPNQTMDIVGNITGNLSGSVGSVTGAVGSVSGAVGSVTGNVGGNITGSIGSVAVGGITASSLASDAITAAKVAADVGTEIAAAVLAAATANPIDANVQEVNDVALIGDGDAIPWGPQ